MRISDWSSDVCSSDLDREVADARADLAPLVAADAPVAAGVEAQGWRHRGQRVGEGVADLAAHDQPVAFAQALEPAGARVHLGESLIRAPAFPPAAQDQGAAAAAPPQTHSVTLAHIRAPPGKGERGD